MKKILFTLFIIGLTVSLSNAQTIPSTSDNPNAGVFKWKEEFWNFDTIPQGTPVTHQFIFTNAGKEPIVLTSVESSCSCISIDWNKDPVLPGKKGSISVTFNAAGTGIFHKTINIISNSSTPKKILYIKGQLKPRSTPK